MTANNFLSFIKAIREDEEVVVNSFLLEIKDEEKQNVGNYLLNAYEAECMDFPFQPPKANIKAAVWAAEIFYLSAQLILHRESPECELDQLFPIDDFKQDASNFLSVDLCFRFLPDLLIELKSIDPEDKLIEKLESYLFKWHYSGVGYNLNEEELEMDFRFQNDCFRQLYANRIISFKNLRLLKNDELKSTILSSLGMYGSELWPDLKFVE